MLTRGDMSAADWIVHSADAGHIRWHWLCDDSRKRFLPHHHEQQDFFARNGGYDAAYSLKLNNVVRFVFPSGAVMQQAGPQAAGGWVRAASFADSEYWEPARDPFVRMVAQILRVATSLQNLMTEFRALNTAVTVGDGRPYPWRREVYGPSSGDVGTDLDKLASLAEPQQKTLIELTAEFDNLPTVVERRKQERAVAAKRHADLVAEQQREEREAAARKKRYTAAMKKAETAFAGVPEKPPVPYRQSMDD